MQPDHPDFKKTIFPFLRGHLPAQAGKPALVNQFIDFLENGSLKEWQFAGCLAIDIKHNLADIKEYALLIEKFKASGADLDLKNFHKFIIDYSPEENIFSGKILNYKNEEYVRIITREVFSQYLGTDAGSPTRNGDDWSPQVAETKLRQHGLSGRKSIIWLTLYEDFCLLLRSTRPSEAANRICDWLGFARDEQSLKSGSPINGGKICYVYIKYPKGFNDACYQPITANANWHHVTPLFLSYPYMDGWGRTFNCRNLSEAAKEVIHKKREYQGETFIAGMIGTPSVAPVDTSKMLSELLTRFG